MDKMDLLNEFIELEEKYRKMKQAYMLCEPHWDNDILHRLNIEMPETKAKLAHLERLIKLASEQETEE